VTDQLASVDPLDKDKGCRTVWSDTLLSRSSVCGAL